MTDKKENDPLKNKPEEKQAGSMEGVESKSSDAESIANKAENKVDPWTNDYVTESVSPEVESNVKESGVAQKQAQETKPKEKGKDKKPDLSKEEWERDLLNRLAFSAVNEQRRSRRWSVFFKFAFLTYVVGILILYFPEDRGDIHIGPHTAMVEISGPIADNAFANANSIITGMRAAFEDKNTKAVVLRINSPGGSPVQAGYINDEIFRLREKYPNTPIYSVVTDMAASAAYYIASGTKDIYADKASIVGSIGVLMDGFGFVDTIDKLGVERRLMTAGENKGFLDPFSPVNPNNKQHMQNLLDNVHEQFISTVKKGRGDRLVENPELFSGLFWSGEKSVELGLIDGLGSLGYVARDIVGEEKVVDFTPRPNYLDRFAERLGVATANTLSSVLFPQGGMK